MGFSAIEIGVTHKCACLPSPAGNTEKSAPYRRAPQVYGTVHTWSVSLIVAYPLSTFIDIMVSLATTQPLAWASLLITEVLMYRPNNGGRGRPCCCLCTGRRASCVRLSESKMEVNMQPCTLRIGHGELRSWRRSLHTL